MRHLQRNSPGSHGKRVTMKITSARPLPVLTPLHEPCHRRSCSFGGDVLSLTIATYGLDGSDLAGQLQAGAIFSLSSGVRVPSAVRWAPLTNLRA